MQTCTYCLVLCQLAWAFSSSNQPTQEMLRSWLRNVHGTLGCVCELDTVHIHVIEVANRVLELAICNLNLLLRDAQAGMDVFDLELPIE